MTLTTDQYWMQYLLDKLTTTEVDVPIAACAVDAEQNLIAFAKNQTIAMNDPTAHAEIELLRILANKLSNYRLPNITVYVTLEPCIMCYGALLQARVARLVYACDDSKFGVLSKHDGLHALGEFNHKLAWSSGVCAREASELLKQFFRARRS